MGIMKKECIAMLLAGGQGARLGVLTESVAKPAVPFGAKYRIIDFPLSNCSNSGIDTVGVLTQYQPFELNQYIGNGQPWDLDRMMGGVYVLPPFMSATSGEWYKGTANAIYQNIPFMDKFDPEYVLILSGDHIYKMDYSKMLKEHKLNNADCTIAVIDVSMEEATRFGIMNTNEDQSIYEFEEKPAKPKSTKASMGVYIYSWAVLKKYLINDEANPKSKNDFGKNIIPAMLENGERLFAYQYKGYWKDVGTISSLWEANMDLLNKKDELNLDDAFWKIYARNLAFPPQYISETGSATKSIISEGSYIAGKVEESIIFTGSEIAEDTEIIGSVIMPHAVIEKGAKVYHSIIGSDARVGANCIIGDKVNKQVNGEWQIAVLGPDYNLPPNSRIKANEMVGGSAK